MKPTILRICLLTCLVLSPVDGFAPPRLPSSPALGRSSPTTKKSTTTQLSALRDPHTVLKLTSTFGSSSMAFPMVVASTAPFGLNDWMTALLHATTTSTSTTTATTTATDAITTAASGPAVIATTLAETTASAFFQAEILNDAAHMALDVVTLAAPTAPSVVIRSAAVFGRILAMAADYLPDHFMLPDELAFQVFMLTISWVSLVQAVLPRFLAATNLASSLQLRDGKAYKALFAPTGMSWNQFKTVTACAMDWIDLDPHQDVPVSSLQQQQENQSGNNQADVEFVYWLYSGDMVVQNNQGKELYTIASAGGSKRVKQDAAQRLLGEAGLLRRLENRRKKKKNFGSTAASSTSQPSASAVRTLTTACNDGEPTTSAVSFKAKAGPSGATLLRMHTAGLERLVRHDEELAVALRTLLFQGLSAKLAAQLEATATPPTPSTSSSVA